MIFVWFGNGSSSSGKAISFLGTWVCRKWHWSSKWVVMEVCMDLVRIYVALRRPLKGKFAGDQVGDPFENQFSRVFSAAINWLLCPKA